MPSRLPLVGVVVTLLFVAGLAVWTRAQELVLTEQDNGKTVGAVVVQAILVKETTVVITWPQAGSSEFFLEGTPSLCPPNWAALNVLPLPIGSDYWVTLAASGQGLFFRLRK